MEALSVLEDERKRQGQRLGALGQQVGQVGRNVVSPLASTLVGYLTQAQSGTDDLHKEFETKLFHALDVLGSTAELIHPSPAILTSSRSQSLIEDPTDNLILASILDHAKNHPSEAKIFLSENRRDFDNNLKARLALRGAGIQYFADASKCLEWHKAQPDP
jgi:hypothetical protein